MAPTRPPLAQVVSGAFQCRRIRPHFTKKRRIPDPPETALGYPASNRSFGNRRSQISLRLPPEAFGDSISSGAAGRAFQENGVLSGFQVLLHRRDMTTVWAAGGARGTYRFGYLRGSPDADLLHQKRRIPGPPETVLGYPASNRSPETDGSKFPFGFPFGALGEFDRLRCCRKGVFGKPGLFPGSKSCSTGGA